MEEFKEALVAIKKYKKNESQTFIIIKQIFEFDILMYNF